MCDEIVGLKSYKYKDFMCAFFKNKKLYILRSDLRHDWTAPLDCNLGVFVAGSIG